MCPEIPSRSNYDPLSDPLLRDVPEIEGYKLLDRRYVIFEVLGRGGMGVVYHGKHTDLENEVAIKCLDPALLRRDEGFVLRFKKEARAAARIQHENVVRVFDVADSHGLHYLVMEFIEGEDVRRRVIRKGPLDPDEACRIALGAAKGLAAAHAAGLIHRDIKPDNILIGTDGRVKVADLGLAKQVDGDGDLTNTGMAMGTPRYMPPEQFSDAKTVGPTADVYALGATLYWMLTGKDGVARGSFMEVADRVRKQAFPDPRVECSQVPDEIAEIVLACTRMDPTDRPRDGAAVVKLLEGLSWNENTSLADPMAGSRDTASMVSPPPADLIVKIRKSMVAEAGVQGDDSNKRGAAASKGKGAKGLSSWRRWAAGAAGFLLIAAAWILGPLYLGTGKSKGGEGQEGTKSEGNESTVVAPAGKIKLETPPDSDGCLYFASTQIVLRGKLVGEAGLIELSQGAEVWSYSTGAGGEFAIPVVLGKGERRQVELGLEGTDVSLAVTVVHDGDPPQLALLEPKESPFRTSALKQDLLVEVTEANLVSVTAGGREMESAGPNRWKTKVFLQEGEQSVRVEAADRAGSIGVLDVELVFDRKDPKLVKSSLKAGQAVQAGEELELWFEFDELLSQGSVEGDAVQILQASSPNGAPAKRISATVQMPAEDGAATLLLNACDLADNCVKVEFSVIVEPPVVVKSVESWAEVLEQDPDPSVVTDADGRARMKATGLPWKVRDRGTGIVMLLVPPGEDVIGASPGDSEAFDNEKPAHRVRFENAFYLGQTELTQAQWKKVMGDEPSKFNGPDLPVEQVSWDRINEAGTGFLAKTGLRLPMESEWEYACRAGTDGPRYGTLGDVAWCESNASGKTHAVGGKAANPWGFEDLLGNVYEWCSTKYDSDFYVQAKAREPVDADYYVEADSFPSLYFAARGGSWSTYGRGVRASCRDDNSSDWDVAPLGFRVARDPNGPAPQESAPNESGLKDHMGTEEKQNSLSPVGSWAEVLEQAPDPSVVTDADGRARMKATGLPWRVRDRGTGIVMLLVPPGEDVIGASPEDRQAGGNEKPAHIVQFTEAFYMGETEVTQAQWNVVMGDEPSAFSGQSLPVERVSWDRINGVKEGFLALAGLRLPRECEWEYACRAGTDGERYEDILNDIAWYVENSSRVSHAVGEKLPNPWGFKDTLGSVWEWCSTEYSPSCYKQAKEKEPVSFSYSDRVEGSTVVVRGGSRGNFSGDVRASTRSSYAPRESFQYVGFRVARNL